MSGKFEDRRGGEGDAAVLLRTLSVGRGGEGKNLYLTSHRLPLGLLKITGHAVWWPENGLLLATGAWNGIKAVLQMGNNGAQRS